MRSKAVVAGIAAILGIFAATPVLTQQVAGPAAKAAVEPIAPAAAAGVPQLTRTDVDAWLDGYMPYALRRGDVAGAVVVVVKDGQVLTQRGFGYSDAEKRKPVDPENTLFRPGSVSKLFTWTAVMQLVEQGKLNLDADVNQYLDFKIPPRDGKPITLRKIMTHTPGFEEAIEGLIFSNPQAIKPLGEVLKRWTPARIFAPGVTPAYSNYATALAGYIVERTSGMSFDDYIDRNVLGRLGMTKSSFRQPLPANLQPLMSKGYALGSGKPEPYELISHAPAGSLAAPGADMAKFMIAHLNNGGVLLKPETAKMMHETKLDILPPLNRMALGFYEQNINGLPVVAHGGDTQWFHSDLLLFTSKNVGIFVSMNSAGKDGVSGPLRAALFEQFADRYFPAANTDGRVDAKTAAEHARMMVGTYISSRRAETSFMRALELAGQFKIGLDAQGGLLVEGVPAMGGAPRKWVEIAPFVWRDSDSHERFAAKVENGQVVRVSFDAVSAIMVWDRAPWYRSTAWITPALLLSLAALAVTALAWPIAAIVRRRYGAQLALIGNDRMAYRLVRGLSAAAVVTLIGWVFALTTMMSSLENLDGSFDPLIWLLQIASVVVFFGLLAVAGWNAWLVWKGKRGWFARIWSVVLVLAAFVTLWTALVFKLISFGTSY
jgi:CubicO group peptidase (beta-lactamase class C family)